MMGKGILLSNQPLNLPQAKYLDNLGDCRFFGLDRGEYAPFEDVRVEEKIPLKMATRSLTEVITARRLLKERNIEEAILFFNNENFSGRENLKFFFSIAGVRLIGVNSSGKTRNFRRREMLLSFLKNPDILTAIEIRQMAWFYFKKITTSNKRGACRNGRKKVLLVTNSLGVGGIEIVILTLLKNIDSTKFEPHIMVLNKEGETGNKIREMGYEITMTGFEPRRYRGVRSLYGCLQKGGYDILHYHGNNPESIPVRLAAVFAGVPVIISHLHGAIDFSIGRWKKRAHYNFLTRNTDKYIACAEAVKNSVTERFGYPKEKISVVHNGIDTGIFSRERSKDEARAILGLPGGLKILCIAARFSREKGHKTFIEAVSLISGGHAFLCLLCGEGPLREELQAMIRGRGLEKYFLFMGLRDDMPLILDAADFSVLPSSSEAFPLSILEAMAKGHPVVATDVGGVREMIIDGETGFVVPPDNPDALAGAVLKILDDDALMRRMGEGASAIAREKYDHKKFADNIERIYEECCNARSV